MWFTVVAPSARSSAPRLQQPLDWRLATTTARAGTWGICTRRAGKLYKARSRLYRSQTLQVNLRLKALAEIYTMHSFAQLCNLNLLLNSFLLQNLNFSNSANLATLLQNFANFGKILAIKKKHVIVELCKVVH